jgi:hypothetical protein
MAHFVPRYSNKDFRKREVICDLCPILWSQACHEVAQRLQNIVWQCPPRYPFVFLAIRCTRFVILSATSMTMSHEPSSLVTKGPAKSIMTVCHRDCGTGSGWRKPYNLELGFATRSRVVFHVLGESGPKKLSSYCIHRFRYF